MDLTSITIFSPIMFSIASSGQAMAIVEDAGQKHSVSSAGRLNCSQTFQTQNALLLEKIVSKESSENDVVVDEKASNCSDIDVIIQKLPSNPDHWKNQVIIGCTFTVAIEILIVVLMVMYWQQIRWTLRKLACPCDQRPNRHRQMHRLEPADVVFDSDNDDNAGVVRPDDEVQIFTSSDGRFDDDRRSADDYVSLSAASYAGLPNPPDEPSAETWNIFAPSSSSSDDSDVEAERRCASIDRRTVS